MSNDVGVIHAVVPMQKFVRQYGLGAHKSAGTHATVLRGRKDSGLAGFRDAKRRRYSAHAFEAALGVTDMAAFVFLCPLPRQEVLIG
jgi:hypothetical protein